MVELINVTAGYGTPVLQAITAAFPMGQVTAIVGPNGCGKSTLLKVAAGLLKPMSGTVTMEEPRAQQVAYLPQSRRLPEMNAGRLVLHGRFPWLGYPRTYRESDILAAKAAMARLEVGECWDRPLSELSGGTRQKCYLAMALCQDASTLFLDEPTSFLDIGHQRKLLELCRELAAEGRAVVLVLHDLPMALRYGDRLLLLDGGQIRAEGTPAQVLASGALEQTFGVRILRLDTPAGVQYVCI